MTELFGSKTNVTYLPPPTDHTLFNKVRENNLSKNHNRILHIGGKAASEDRNGTKSVVDMLKYAEEDFQVVIRTQTPLDIKCDDPRLVIDNTDSESRESMYDGFDAMVLPRRYAGLCLPMNEALISGMPVFMTDVSPNNQILPGKWLVESKKIGEFKTKSMVNIYEANPERLANMIDKYIEGENIKDYKNKAVEIGFNNFSVEVLKDKYLQIINE
jgi:glycosyltransferase involved in cell wall biosynthesis